MPWIQSPSTGQPGTVAAALLAGVALGLGPWAGPARAERLPGPFAATVVAVTDGDTLTVRARVWLDLEVVARVRIDGIDAPELRGRCAREGEAARRAQALLGDLVAGGGVVLREVGHDKYGGRVRARVETSDGRDLGAALVAAGLARRYGGGARRSWCEVAERP